MIRARTTGNIVVALKQPIVATSISAQSAVLINHRRTVTINRAATLSPDGRILTVDPNPDVALGATYRLALNGTVASNLNRPPRTGGHDGHVRDPRQHDQRRGPREPDQQRGRHPDTECPAGSYDDLPGPIGPRLGSDLRRGRRSLTGTPVWAPRRPPRDTSGKETI